MSNNIKYWKGEDELTKNPSFLAAQRNEFHDDLPLDEVFKTEKICSACIDTNHLVLGTESGMIYIVNFKDWTFRFYIGGSPASRFKP